MEKKKNDKGEKRRENKRDETEEDGVFGNLRRKEAK